MKQRNLLEKVRHVIENHADDTSVKAIGEEIVFLEGWCSKDLIVTDKADTCYPFKFYLSQRIWGFERRSLRTIDGDSIYRGGEDYDAISLEKAKAIIGANLPDETLLEKIDNYTNKASKIYAAKEWRPTTKIRETRTPSGEMVTINKDGTKSSQPLGVEIVTVYECPCGKGTVATTFENMPGYRDSDVSIQCGECRQGYIAEYNWARDGVPVLKNKKDII